MPQYGRQQSGRPISPLAGEMSGRTEGGAKRHQPSRQTSVPLQRSDHTASSNICARTFSTSIAANASLSL
ncbi:hypothetical protein C7I84_23765 [Mesorhizobium ephedrae]|uniref:Propionyl-coenzyme A carboxylase alpha polypeptide n=1 Tax=Kumtagia ephedrae TaxID=2116701 RepID=A0A2P7RX83_9HYPH|nr:hypothetical protein C7I84_23765 [Mesorhizobium ephedrae]